MPEVSLAKADRLHQWGYKVCFSVKPNVFGKDPDAQNTLWCVKEWCRTNLLSDWEVFVVRRHVWSPSTAWFEITCSSTEDKDRVRDFFCY